jgi:uncharacterized damage-inducible protein DinB
MTLGEAWELFAYGEWATRRMFTVAEVLPPELGRRLAAAEDERGLRGQGATQVRRLGHAPPGTALVGRLRRGER